MVEKIGCLEKFEDNRGELYLFDLDKIDKGKISESIKLHFGKQIFKKSTVQNTLLICIQGELEILMLNNDATKSIKLVENEFYQLKDSIYSLSSSENSIFIELSLVHTYQYKNDQNYGNYVLTRGLEIHNNTVDLYSTLTNFNFGVKRLFYIKNVSKGNTRGDHSHSSCAEIMMAVKGQFTLTENNQKEYILNNCQKTYLIPTNILTKESNFSEDAICLVLADTPYDPSGYH